MALLLESSNAQQQKIEKKRPRHRQTCFYK